ncbi:MAG: hypothetical protein QOI78_5150 [Actinomycetota bacterium]|nr:hypothetical protein [Actinomycetota bacterium]
MRLTRLLKLVAAILVAAAVGVSAASAVVGGQAAPAAQSPEAQAGSDSVDQTAPDPRGGPDWAVRVYTSTTAACVELGRVSAGRFGQLDADGSFYGLPLDEGGTCGDLETDPVILAVNRYPAEDGRGARTVLFGQASRGVTDVHVMRGDGTSRAHPGVGPAGGFVLPLAGMMSPTVLPTVVTLSDGRHVSFDWK